MYLSKLFMFFALIFISPVGLANEVAGQMDLTDSWYGVIAVLVFIITFDWICGRCSTEGAGKRYVQIFCPSTLVMGNWSGLCREYLGAFPGKCKYTLESAFEFTNFIQRLYFNNKKYFQEFGEPMNYGN